MYVELALLSVDNVLPELRQILAGSVTSPTDFDPARVDVGATVVAVDSHGQAAWEEIWCNNPSAPTNCVWRCGSNYLQIFAGQTSFSYRGFERTAFGSWYVDSIFTVSGFWFRLGKSWNSATHTVENSFGTSNKPIAFPTTAGPTTSSNRVGFNERTYTYQIVPDFVVVPGSTVVLRTTPQSLLISQPRTSVTYLIGAWWYSYITGLLVSTVLPPGWLSVIFGENPSLTVIRDSWGECTMLDATLRDRYYTEQCAPHGVNQLLKVPIVFYGTTQIVNVSTEFDLWYTNSSVSPMRFTKDAVTYNLFALEPDSATRYLIRL